MRKKLPPLTSLEGFEAAARLGSFSAAAEELNLTQSAISHQIRLLEESLGQPVFRRLHRSVVLTDAGRDFRHSVTAILDGLREGVRRLEPYKKPGSVVVYCDPGLASGWLALKLSELHALYPRIDVWLVTTTQPVDFARDEVDILIRRHPTPPLVPPDVRVQRLFGEVLRPIASPKLVASLRRRSATDWLQHATLLHEEGFDGWPLWFSQHGAVAGEKIVDTINAGPNFSDAFVMLQTAAADLGLALGSDRIAASFLADRRLAWLSSRSIESPNSYFISATDRVLTEPDIKAVFDWIVGLAR